MEGESGRPWRSLGAEEHARFEFLLRLYFVTGADARRVVHAPGIGRELGLSPVETFAVVEYLARRGFLDYLGAGPRVRISPQGIHYIERGAGDRRSIRD